MCNKLSTYYFQQMTTSASVSKNQGIHVKLAQLNCRFQQLITPLHPQIMFRFTYLLHGILNYIL